MCDVKRNSGLALLVAGAIGSGDGLFLCITLLVCREEGRPGPGTSPATPTSCRRCHLPPPPPTAVLFFPVPLQALKHV